MKTITVEYLKSIEACQNGIDFMVRNGLEGYPLSRVSEIEGDYKGFVYWLTCDAPDSGITVEAIEVDRPITDNELCTDHQYEFDAAGNVTKETTDMGDEYYYEYDAAGNKVKDTYPNGGFVEWSFDHNEDGTFTVTRDGERILMVPKF